MLTRIFTLAVQNYRWAQVAYSKVAREVAYATCPAENVNDVRECYTAADRIRKVALALSETPNREVEFLGDFFEMQENFDSYSDLVSFWGEVGKDFLDEEERAENPRVARLTQAAQLFTRSFKGLPVVTRAFVNASLSCQKGILISQIEYQSAGLSRSVDL